MDTTPTKNILRSVYRAAVGAATVTALPFRTRDNSIRVFYGGSRAGSSGGPLVKVGLLQGRFPEHVVGFSLVYMLSNAIYLPASVIARVREAGVPVALNQNGVFYRAWFPSGWERENARMAQVHAVADHVFYQSEFCRRCAERFLGRRNGSAEILYNAVDTESFRPDERDRKPPFTFLVTGRISRSTAHRLASSIAGLAAARKGGLDVRLAVAGGIEPTVLADAGREIERMGVADAVVFSGAYGRRAASAIYCSADAYLMTKQNDPCPNSVLEALASGLPVLYSASGGVPELVGEAGVGLPVPETFDEVVVPEPQAIAEGMAAVVKGRESMAQAARARAVARFAIGDWFDRHEALFKRLLGASA